MNPVMMVLLSAPVLSLQRGGGTLRAHGEHSLAAYSGGGRFAKQSKTLAAALGRFKPEMIFVSAGFDARTMTWFR